MIASLNICPCIACGNMCVIHSGCGPPVFVSAGLGVALLICNINVCPCIHQDTVPISISIVNDLEPELEETFRVELVSVDGGARLGSDINIVVTILRSDDINGVFQFTGLTVVSTCVRNSVQHQFHYVWDTFPISLIWQSHNSLSGLHLMKCDDGWND